MLFTNPFIIYIQCLFFRMKSFEINGQKILLANHKGELYAVGNKCSHYGAPLEKGSLCNGRVRCPWHGACFNLKTGVHKLSHRTFIIFYLICIVN